MTFAIDPQLQAVLDDLHARARDDKSRWETRTRSNAPGQNARGGGDLVRLGEFFLAVSPEEGRLLYLLARACKARRIVEFGASFGISSLYLGAAARANGGQLITTEVHPEKCAALRRTFEKAGLANHITLLEGDARDTLADITGPIDMLLLDGWKSAYLPVYALLRPKLPIGTLVLADNCHHEAAADYLAAIRDPESGVITEIRDDLAISCVVA